MRPTIPLASWRIATDLAKSRAVATLLPAPSCQRTCPWCRNWVAVHATVLSPALLEELRRLGVDPALPGDLYAFAEPAHGDDEVPHRVTFYTAGHVLGGPDNWLEDPQLGRMRRYEPVAGRSGDLRPGLSVADVGVVGVQVPGLPASAGPLVQIDFRIPLPWALDEPRPAVWATRPRQQR